MVNIADMVRVQEYLENDDYPCDRNELMSAAQNEGVDREVFEFLSSLPAGIYISSTEVEESLEAVS